MATKSTLVRLCALDIIAVARAPSRRTPLVFRTSCDRAFTTWPPRMTQHKTYFQPDSQRAASSGGLSTRPTNAVPTPDAALPQIVVLPAQPNAAGSRWPVLGIFLLGLLASPILYTSFLTVSALVAASAMEEEQDGDDVKNLKGQFRPSGPSNSMQPVGQHFAELSEEELASPAVRILALEKRLLEAQMEVLSDNLENEHHASELASLLDSANISQLKVHKTLLDVLIACKDDKVILDEATLASHPIVLSDKTRLPDGKAALIRVLDAEGKNKMILLGVDVDYHEDHRSSSSRFPNDCYELDQWLCDLADELARSNGNASDVALYLYSNRVILDINQETGNRWMTRYRPSDFPPGFPLQQMRQIELVQESNGSIANMKQRDGATTRSS